MSLPSTQNQSWELGDRLIILLFLQIGGNKAHKINTDFEWQSRFYDHIIRNEKSFHIITDERN
jgi:hypothetical protein